MQQIFLQSGRKEINGKLIGKTIKDISFGLDVNEEKSYLILSFTDGTYIHLNVEEDSISSDSDYKIYQIKNDMVVPLKCYAGIPGYVYEGNFHYYPYIEEEIRMGLLEPDREYEMKRIEEDRKRAEEREYETYLKLKEKFENK